MLFYPIGKQFEKEFDSDRIEQKQERVVRTRAKTFFDLLPFSVYLGWISVATIANISYYLVELGWEGFGLSDQIWTIIMLIVSAGLAIWFRYQQNDLAFPLVFVWAIIGIGVANQVDYPIVNVKYIEIVENTNPGYGEKIFDLYDMRDGKALAKFHVRRENRPLDGYWFNFHYHEQLDNYETHHTIGEVYWSKNTPPKWMS